MIRSIILSCTLAVVAMPASAAIFAGNTTDSPSYRRPRGSDPTETVFGRHRYDVFKFNVSQSGTFDFTMFTADNAFDTVIGIYQTAFDPASASTNILGQFDGDQPGLPQEIFSVDFTTGIDYFAVISGFTETDFGEYRLEVTGPGEVVGAEVGFKELVLQADTTNAPFIPYWEGFGRLNPGGSAGPVDGTRYVALPFTITEDGQYTFQLDAVNRNTNFDTVLGLYSGTFDPLNLTSGALLFNDDDGLGDDSGFIAKLAAGDYTALAAGYLPNDFGPVRFRVTGPAAITSPLAVPEPATWATMIGGFGLMGGALRRRGRPGSAYA